MNERIDLSTAPSAMEELARSWATTPQPRPTRAYAATLPPRPRPSSFRPPQIKAPDLEEQHREIARRDAEKALARDVPDPKRYARYLETPLADALLRARHSRGAWRFDAYETPRAMEQLRRAGLAYIAKGDDCLTLFAQQVRRALAEGDA